MQVTELLEHIIPLLCRWYEANRKSLPWRDNPTPYHVWLSEIMLQQTRIEAVIPYYLRFLSEFPTVEALSKADDEKLMKLWQGLGYYSRARNLKKAAVKIMEECGGELPQNSEELRCLPGIGDYTAGAIASIAYQKPEPAVDGNVLRVMMRLFACEDDIMLSATRKRITALLREHYPSGKDAALLTEGLMELGELVCIPNGEPHCKDCPIREYCHANRKGIPSSYPVRSPKKERRIEDRTVFLLRCGKKYALCKRPEEGLLAGMWEFPNLEGTKTAKEADEELKLLGFSVTSISSCGKAKHIFSHVEWHMVGYEAECREMLGGYIWVTPEEMKEKYAIPTAFRAFCGLLKSD